MSEVIYVGGQHSYLKYGWETSFKGGATSRDKVFGRGVSISSLSSTVETRKISELGTIVPSYIVSDRFGGSMEIRWILSNPWFLKAVYGSVETTGSSAPYTHTFTVSEEPATMELEVGIKRKTLDVKRLLRGAIPTRLGISFSTGEDVACSMSISFADEKKETGAGTPEVDSFPPFKASQAKLLINDVERAGIQSISLTFDKNPTMQYVIGERRAEDVTLGMWDVSGSFSGMFHSTDALEELLNAEDWEKVSILISNGKTGEDEVSLEIILNEVKLSSHGMPISPNAVIVEEVEFVARTASAVAKNAVAAVP